MTILLWTFPVIMAASVVIGWAAEITAVHLSAGIALAVLAWLQTAPEFAVEATIAWQRDTHLALANLTGSLRLLMGLGWPMIFFIHWFSRRRAGVKVRDVVLPEAFSVEAAGLAVPVLYFLFITAKGTWTALDGVILCGFYALYFWLLNLERKRGVRPPGVPPGQLHSNGNGTHGESDEEPWVVRKVLSLGPRWQVVCALAMFALGGLALLVTVHSFVDALKGVAAALGVSSFVFIQWVAPIASEFPEKITAFSWARRPRKVPMAIVNMLSSVTSQWTLLAGLVPIVFSLSAGRPFTIELSAFQKSELLLTVFQSALAVVFLADLRIKAYEAVGLFVLWFAQFVVPSWRQPLTLVYAAWFLAEGARLALNPSRCLAWSSLRRLLFGR